MKNASRLCRIGLIAILTGCASASGPKLSETTLAEPAPGDAQIVFFRPGNFAGGARAPSVDINGVTTCDLPNNGAFAYNVGPGHVTVALSHWDMPGTSQLAFDVEPDKSYYVRVDVDEGKAWAPGLIGRLIAESASTNKGPYQLKLLDKGQADAQIGDVRLADCKANDTQQAQAPDAKSK